MKVRHFSDVQAMTEEAADALSETLVQSLPQSFAVMLSGGNTPLPVYQRLAALQISVSPRAHVLFSDERFAPPASPDSNYGRVRFLFDALHLPEDRIFAVPTDLSLREAADAYDAQLRDFLAHGGRILFGLLGVGSDGHTASLFTADDLERGHQRYAIAVPRPTKPDRVSVTPLLLKSCERILLLIAGSHKKEITEALIKTPTRVIAGRALAECPNAECWIAP